MMTKQIDTNR